MIEYVVSVSLCLPLSFVRGLVSSSAVFPTNKSILDIVKRVLNVGMPYIQCRQKESVANVLSFSLNCAKVLSCHPPLLFSWLQGPFIQNSNSALFVLCGCRQNLFDVCSCRDSRKFQRQFPVVHELPLYCTSGYICCSQCNTLASLCFLPTTVDKLLTMQCAFLSIFFHFDGFSCLFGRVPLVECSTKTSVLLFLN